jgi:cell division protein FtsW (lipid II flippase)
MAFKARKNVPWAFYTGLGVLIVFAAFMALAIMHYPHVQHRIMQMFSAAPVNSQTYIAQHALTSSAIVGSTTESLHWLAILPESVTDYIFTGMIAKFGILMGLLILALYGCVVKGLADTIRNTKDQFDKILSAGTLGLFAIYTIMALAVAFGLLATAAYWPFISFGGNILLTWCILFGFVLAMNKNRC